jgi:RHS repeat-associated protein
VFGYRAQWGGYTDSETGLVLQGHRFYDPATGTWLTRDPIGQAGGVNVYGYVGGDPVNWGDPRGLDRVGLGYGYTRITGNKGLSGAQRGRGAAFSLNIELLFDDRTNEFGLTCSSGHGYGIGRGTSRGLQLLFDPTDQGFSDKVTDSTAYGVFLPDGGYELNGSENSFGWTPNAGAGAYVMHKKTKEINLTQKACHVWDWATAPLEKISQQVDAAAKEFSLNLAGYRWWH